jgi:hypothetical protein
VLNDPSSDAGCLASAAEDSAGQLRDESRCEHAPAPAGCIGPFRRRLKLDTRGRQSSTWVAVRGGSLDLLPLDTNDLRRRSASAAYDARNPLRTTNLGSMGNI